MFAGDPFNAKYHSDRPKQETRKNSDGHCSLEFGKKNVVLIHLVGWSGWALIQKALCTVHHH